MFVTVPLMFSVLISPTCKAPPSPPQNLRVTNVTSKSVTIEWETPDSNGGTEITSYIIEKLLTKSSQWSRVATLDNYCLSYCIDNLKETTELNFRVVAENAIGISAPAYTEPVTLKTHASTFHIVVVVHCWGERQLFLSMPKTKFLCSRSFTTHRSP